MAKFKAGDLAVCVNVDRNFGCIDFGELTKGKPYVVKKISGNDVVHVVNNKGHEFGYYECRFAPAFAVDGCVKCVNATASDLTEGRFYTVRDITGGGALILHGNDSRPYRHDRFELADNSEWVKQAIREKDAAQKEFEAKTLTIESVDLVTLSPPVNPAGWDIEIDDSNPASPAVRMKRREFKVGDRVSHLERPHEEFIIEDIDFQHAKVVGDSYRARFLMQNLRMAKDLKVSERVVCIKEDPHYPASIGEIGLVISIASAGSLITTTAKPRQWVPSSLYVRTSK